MISIIEFTRQYMHRNYPITRSYKYFYHDESDPKVNGVLYVNGNLSQLDLHIYNNRTPQLQAKFFMHEYHHITQLERHGFDEQLNNRFRYEIETENFCRLEFQKVLDLYNAEFGTDLECSIYEAH